MGDGHEGRLQTGQQGDPVSREGLPEIRSGTAGKLTDGILRGDDGYMGVIEARLAVLPGNPTGRDYRGFGNAAGVEMRIPPRKRKNESGNPPPTTGATGALSQQDGTT
jgi:hypothetical protein